MSDAEPSRARSWRAVPLTRLVLAWLILLGLVVVAFWLLSWPTLPPVYVLALPWFVASKSAALLCMPPEDRRRLSWWRFTAFLLFGGIQQPRRFLPEFVPTKEDIRPTIPGTVLNLVAGLLFLYGIPALSPAETPWLVRLWSGLIGVGFLTLFVRFDVLVLVFRWLGFGVEKCWHNPLAAVSLADFWGNRWNRVMSGLLRDVIFLPLARRAGPTVALVAVFVYSGVLHEFVSVVARGGYGQPTLYFLIQGAGVWLEGRGGVRRVLLRRPWLGRLWTMLVVVGPLGLVFHTPFLVRVVEPLLRESGMPGLSSETPVEIRRVPAAIPRGEDNCRSSGKSG